VILACPQTTPPENLFNTLSAQPALLATLLAVISPASLLDVLVTKLLNPPDDAAGCADDPQGSLTRFGEGVVLVEAVVALFDVSGVLPVRSNGLKRIATATTPS
jgi:mediator of RNA polymerase II transcription subunit 5